MTATITESPIEYLKDSADRARSLLHLNGGRVLQIYVAAQNRATAMIWKIALHLTIDVLVTRSASRCSSWRRSQLALSPRRASSFWRAWSSQVNVVR